MDPDMLKEFERLKALEQKLKINKEHNLISIKKSKQRPEYIQQQKKYNKDYYQKKKLSGLGKIPKETLFKDS